MWRQQLERLGLWTLRCSKAEHRDRRLEETRYPCLIKIGWENNGTQQKRRRVDISENYYGIFTVGKKIMHLTLEAGNLNALG